MLVPSLIVAVACLYGIIRIGFYTLRKKQERDPVGVFIGVSLIVLVALFGFWGTHFLAFRAD